MKILIIVQILCGFGRYHEGGMENLLRHDLPPDLPPVCLFSPMFLQLLKGFLELSCSLSLSV